MDACVTIARCHDVGRNVNTYSMESDNQETMRREDMLCQSNFRKKQIDAERKGIAKIRLGVKLM